MALPESLIQLSVRGPEELRPAFAAFAQDYRTSGRFQESLDLLKVRLADPVADRIVESLRIAREVGGSDLGRLLRTLSAFLREDARTRAEMETRQGWTVNAARLAVAAPWLVLAMMSTRAESIRAYNSPGGVLVPVSYTHLDVYKRQEEGEVRGKKEYFLGLQKQNRQIKNLGLSFLGLTPEYFNVALQDKDYNELTNFEKEKACLLYTSRCV